MKIELEKDTLTAETVNGADYDNIRAIIGLLHGNKSLEGVGILKLKGLSHTLAIKLIVDLCNDMRRPFKVVAIYIEQVGFEVQQSWDRTHPPGSIIQ